jgi:hypothetical protein
LGLKLIHSALNPTARRSVLTSVEALDLDRFGPIRRGSEISHLVTAMAGQENKVGEALARIKLDNMPHNWHSPNFHERLGERLGSCLQARPAAATENQNFGKNSWVHSTMIAPQELSAAGCNGYDCAP